MNVSQYIGAGKKPGNPTKLLKQRQITERWTDQERHWYRIWTQLTETSFFKQQHIPKAGSFTHKIFQKLLKKVERERIRGKRHIDPRIYIRAHLNYFGKAMFPAQLNTRFSWNLYDAYDMLVHLKKEKKVPQIVWDAITLNALAEARKTSEEIVLKQFKDSRLFSAKFLRQRGIK